MNVMYFDTGVALKLVVEEPLSARVREYVREKRAAVPVSLLMEVEIESALHALRFRNLITDGQLAGARVLVVELITSGRFREIDFPLERIARESLSLAPLVTAKTGCRTLDLMHVATAKLMRAGVFISTDKRQIEAARMCGLQTVNLEEKNRRRDQ